MHILPHSAAGGATLLAMELAQRLNPARYRVTLAVGPESCGEGNLLDEMRERGLEVIVIPNMRRAPHLTRDARALLELSEVIHRERPQIVHTHGSKPRLLTPLATAFDPAPIRVAHLWGWEWMPAQDLARRSAYAWGARVSAQGYDALIACSDAMRRQGLARGVGESRQYEVVLPSVDLTRFSPKGREQARSEVRGALGIPLDATVVVSVMRLARQKAPHILLQAAAELARRLPALRWLLVGGGPLEPEVREMVNAPELRDRVILAGPRRDVARLLKASDVFALASSWEPFGIGYLEASAVGLPVIGTRVDGAPEAVLHPTTGLLVEPHNPEQLAAAIATVATDPRLARSLGEAGAKRARQFGHERFVGGIERIYERLLARNSL
jgi:glycosyltransferase involved in cell wall biosynthesis